MIVVATADFEVYHELVTELRARGVRFTTVEPGDDLPDGTQLVLTAPEDDPVVPTDASSNPDSAADSDPDPGLDSGSAPGSASASAENAESTADDPNGDADTDIEVVVAEPGDARRAIDEALTTLRGADGRTVIGVDPGDRPGIAVRSGGVVVAAFQVPLAEAASVVEREAAEASDPIVRIGDGARLKGASIVDELDSELITELVDETGTTPHLGSGARGMGDVLAAVNIARRPGDRVSNREIDPTPGEIETIKRRSREQSNGDRTIDETLARRVAYGELTVREALDEHRNG